MARWTASAKWAAGPALDGKRDMPLALRLSEGLGLTVDMKVAEEACLCVPVSGDWALWIEDRGTYILYVIHHPVPLFFFIWLDVEVHGKQAKSHLPLHHGPLGALNFPPEPHSEGGQRLSDLISARSIGTLSPSVTVSTSCGCQ